MGWFGAEERESGSEEVLRRENLAVKRFWWLTGFQAPGLNLEIQGDM
jgi:hypothetical protein